MFLFAKQNNIAYCGALKLDDGRTLTIDIPVFCHTMVNGAYAWLDQVEDTARFKANLAKSMELFQLSFEN